jgi:hypothetical protein
LGRVIKFEEFFWLQISKIKPINRFGASLAQSIFAERQTLPPERLPLNAEL